MASTTTEDLVAGARDALQHLRFDDDAQLVDPRVGDITRGVVGVLIGGATWALPSRCRVSPGAGVLYVLAPDDGLHVLVNRRERVRELIVPRDIADRIRRELFSAA